MGTKRPLYCALSLRRLLYLISTLSVQKGLNRSNPHSDLFTVGKPVSFVSIQRQTALPFEFPFPTSIFTLLPLNLRLDSSLV